MSKDEIANFHNDIGEVLSKYGIGCFAGIWLSGRGSDELGVLRCADITDTQMVNVSNKLEMKMIEWKNEMCTPDL